MAFRNGSWVLLAGLSLVAGCGGGDDDDSGSASQGGVSAATVASYEGLYQLTRLTQNDVGCEVEGPSVVDAGTEPEFVMMGVSGLGYTFLELVSCADAPSCAEAVRTLRAMGAVPADYFVFFSSEDGPDRLAGLTATGGYDRDGQCVSRSYEDHALTRTTDSVRVQSRTTPLADIASDSGACWAEAAKQKTEAAGRPCASLRVIEGTKTGPLPE